MESSVDEGLGSHQIEIQGEHFSQRDLEVNKRPVFLRRVETFPLG